MPGRNKGIQNLKSATVYNVQWCDLGGIQRIYIGEEMEDEEFKNLITEVRNSLGSPIPRRERMDQFDEMMHSRGLYRVHPHTYHVWPMLQDE